MKNQKVGSKRRVVHYDADSVTTTPPNAESYVYSFAAVEGRLRRGHKSVLLFIPNDGRLARVTRKNLAKVKRTLRAQTGLSR